MERIADQEAEIKRIAEKNHYELGMEDIRRLREKDIMEYDFKNKELEKKHEEFILHENHRHEEAQQESGKNFELKKIELNNEKDKNDKEIEAAEKELQEIKNQGAANLKRLDNEIKSINENFKQSNLSLEKQHEEK